MENDVWKIANNRRWKNRPAGSIASLVFAVVLFVAAGMTHAENPPAALELNLLNAGKFEQVTANCVEFKMEKRTPDATEESLKITMSGNKWSGVIFRPAADVDAGKYDALIIKINSNMKLNLIVRFVDADKKQTEQKFGIVEGDNTVQTPVASLKSALDVTKINQIHLFSREYVPGTIFWLDVFGFGKRTEVPVPVPTALQWDPATQLSRPDPFAQPDPELLLWHTFNEEQSVEDVLDWSKNGSIGEYNNGDHLPTGSVETHNYGLRVYGEPSKESKCLGYRIMPSDKLNLKEGTISFWILADPDIQTKRGVIFTEAGGKKYISLSNVKNKTTLSFAFGKKIDIKDIPFSEWVHVAWTFDAGSQEVFINGESKLTDKSGAQVDGKSGFFVGHDGSRWEKVHGGADGFSGMLDDLRIYNKKVNAYATLPTKPDAATPKLGLVLWYDFQDYTAKDMSGNNLDGTDTEIKTKNVAAWTAWKPEDKGWEFYGITQKACSQVKTPLSPLLNLTDGTMELRFKITAQDNYNAVLSVSNHNSADSDCTARIRMNNYLKEKGAKVKNNHMKIALDSTESTEFPREINWNEWVKLVIVWHVGSDTSDRWYKVWINDEPQGTGLYDRKLWQIYGQAGPIRFGQHRDKVANSEGCNMIVSDFKLYNFARSVYITDTTPK